MNHESSCDGIGCIDSEIWFPPEPEDVREDDIEGIADDYVDDIEGQEDDIEGGVAANYGDDMNGVKKLFMRYLEAEWGARVSFGIKDKKIGELFVHLKAEFKNLMEHRLISMGASFSRTDGDNAWVKAVTDLSWDAVLYMKPDAFLGKPVDPKLYVKVKCIATESPNQWKVIKETGSILLKGSDRDELKKIKTVAEVAVFIAYLLIRENLVTWGSMVHKFTENTIFSNCDEDLTKHKGDLIAVLGAGGISIFISRRNAKTGTACKQSLSDIKLYRNFDMHIGMFLMDYSFNQKLLCGTCNELPEAHISYFTHHDKRITVEVRSLPSDKHLPGEAEGKVWGWDYCGESNEHSKRTLLSFGSKSISLQLIIKELFEDSLLWECDTLANCVFLGLGSMVVMLRLSRVPTYSVSLPRRKFEFSDLMERDFLQKEVENVVQEGCSLFAEVENSLKEMEEQSLEGSCEIFHDIKKMLKQEQDQFEVDMCDVSVNKRALYLNHIQWKLSLLSHIWDQRFCCLRSSDLNTQLTVKKQSCFQEICGGDGVLSLKSADPQGWMWRPFSEIVSIYSKDLHKGSLPRYEASTHNTESIIYKRIAEEGSRLHFPLGSPDNNHIVSDYEDEFSSIIACALASPADRKKSPDVISYQTSQKISSLSSLNWCCINFLKGPDGSSICDPSEESFYSIFDEVEWENRSSYLHPLISMGRSPNRPKYSVACLFHKEFLNLRSHCGLSEPEYISSLSRCKPWDAKGGKSKSVFAKTLDDRFIIKQISSTEFSSFHETAVAYFAYMNSRSETCLAKILGVYQVTSEKSGAKYDLMVMENIAYCRTFARIYDLKGALYNRLSPATDGAGDVLLDQNFVNDMKMSPLHVNWKAEWRLQQAIWNDTAFLHLINVMDYSLLVGVDAKREELVCGIIDSVRQYTFDKKMETLFKSWLIVPKNYLPTIIPPEEYKKRFRKFIGNHVNDPISVSLQEYKKVQYPKAQINL